MITGTREELVEKNYTFFARIPVGLPLLVWNATFNVRLSVRTPLLERMILELIDANVTERDVLAGYLGLSGEPIFADTLITMLHTELVYVDQDDFALTDAGKRALAQDYKPADVPLEQELIYDPYNERYSYYTSEDLLYIKSRTSLLGPFNVDEIYYVRDIEHDLADIQALFQNTVPVADNADSSECEVLSVRSKTQHVEHRRVEVELWFQAKAHQWAFIILTGSDPDLELSEKVLDLSAPNKPLLDGQQKPNLPFSSEGKWINRTTTDCVAKSKIAQMSPAERDKQVNFLFEHSKEHIIAVFDYWSDAEELRHMTVNLAKALLHHATLKMTIFQSRYAGSDGNLIDQNSATFQRLNDFANSYSGRVKVNMIDEVADHHALSSELGGVLTSTEFRPREINGAVGFSRNASWWIEGAGVLREFERYQLKKNSG